MAKIALVGTDGTGKSRLAKEISLRYNVPIIPEFAREIAEELGIKDLRKIPVDKTCIFQNMILERKMNEEAKHTSFIADRSTCDNMAYYLRWCSNEMHDSYSSTYINICKNNLKIYDKIIVLPWGAIPHEADGFRTSKLYYSYEIHCLIIGILQDLKVPYTILEETDINERVKYFSRFFEQPVGKNFELQTKRESQPTGVL